MDRVIRDGRVAVIFSPGYGSGWYTSHDIEALIFDSSIVQWIEAEEYDKIKNYSRSPRIINSKFNFGFQNDYNYDVSNNCINNYKFIVDQFNTKIADFKKSLKNENQLIFINFSLLFNSLHLSG